MDNELRAAADRIRDLSGDVQDCLSGGMPHDTLTYRGSLLHELLEASMVLQRAYLAENADNRQGGPISSERWTLDELITELEKWKLVASGKTCVSFENICYGASSLWHQTHRENFRAVDRKPEELSRWVLKYANFVHEDFPGQVLRILESLLAENERLKQTIPE